MPKLEAVVSWPPAGSRSARLTSPMQRSGPTKVGVPQYPANVNAGLYFGSGEMALVGWMRREQIDHSMTVRGARLSGKHPDTGWRS